MELERIAIRAAATFIILLLLLRLSGKRTISQGSMLDFVVALVLGDLIDDAVWAEVPFSQFIIGVSTLIVIHLGTGLRASSNSRFHRWIDGEPVVLMESGEPVSPSLRAERISLGELGEHLRHQGLLREKWHTVRRAILELSGHVSVVKDEPGKPAQKRDRPRLLEIVK
jgi:uncharacterized membrane protein YcaP (DUF421 family)